MIERKILTIFGTRPEAIKIVPIIKELRKYDFIKNIICVTGQHKEMLHQVLDIFKIVPDYDLDIMKKNQTLSEITSQCIIKLDKIIKDEKPDLVLVHGDTTTTLGGSLAAFYNGVKIGHVEAGLRTHNKFSPYPEEINRQITDMLSDLYFAPTEMSKQNLINENIPEDKIYVTGNTAIDTLKTTVSSEYNSELLNEMKGYRIILLTAHRRENIGSNMKNMFNAVNRILEEFDDIQVIYPVHLNPKVREIAQEIFKDHERINIIEPLDVIDFHNMLNHSYLILTDSGGIQEEAPSLGKPVLVLRDTTERPEGIIAGTLKLAGVKEDEIYNSIKLLLTNQEIYNSMSKSKNPYGDGNASKYIVKAILKELFK